MSEWINTNERLPEIPTGKCCVLTLVITTKGIIEVAAFSYGVITYGPREGVHVGSWFFNGKKQDVTHWMPLPKAP